MDALTGPNARLKTDRHRVDSPGGAGAGGARVDLGATAFVLILPALVTLALAACFWHGMQATDDLRYARMAIAVLPGEHSASLALPPHHHDARIALVYPLAAVFAAFGASEASLALLPAVCSALTASLVAWLALPLGGRAAGLAAGLLFAFFPLTLGLSTFFVPEPIAGFETCVAAALFLRAIERDGERPRRLLLFVAGFVVGIAYLTTEVGALMLPVFYAYLIATQRRVARDHHALLGGFAIVLLAELAFHFAVHGDPLYRFSLATRYLDDPMLIGANANLGYRLFKAIPAMFAYPSLEFGLFGPLLVAAGIYGLVRGRRHLFFVLWAACILLFYNFMSVSPSRYVVLPVTARLLAPACLPLVVLCGAMIADAGDKIARAGRGRKRAGRLALVVAGSVVVVASLFAMWLDAHSLTLTRAVAQNARQAAAFLRRYPAVVVVTDRRSAAALQFYRRFDPDDVLVTFDDASRSLGPARDGATPAFALRNGPVLHEQTLTGERYGRPFLRPADRASLERLLESRHTPIFTAQLHVDPVLGTLLAHAPVRALLGQRRTQIAERLLEQPSLGAVDVHALGATASR